MISTEDSNADVYQCPQEMQGIACVSALHEDLHACRISPAVCFPVSAYTHSKWAFAAANIIYPEASCMNIWHGFSMYAWTMFVLLADLSVRHRQHDITAVSVHLLRFGEAAVNLCHRFSHSC